MPNRREFMKQAAGTGALLGLNPSSVLISEGGPASQVDPQVGLPPREKRLDLSPASWIWYPSSRTLPGTVILFRREIRLSSPVRSATGWIAAESRYLLTVNGRRVQWGPAPADPRRMEVDPIDLVEFLRQGENVLGATVLHYGHGDGTHPIGKPGFILTLRVEFADGTVAEIRTGDDWSCRLATSWPPGSPKRWYLRSFQEQFDAREYPYGWDSPGATADANWLPAMKLDCAASLPPVCSRYPDHLYETHTDVSVCCLQPRSIPLLRESFVPVKALSEQYVVHWSRPAEEYFSMVPADGYSATPQEVARETGSGQWQMELHPGQTVALTFELAEQLVGFPEFIVEAPAGTTIEALAHEAHDAGGPALLNTHFHSWSRFICRQGENVFRTFDYESLRWLQLVIRNGAGTVALRNVGVLRRMYPWPAQPDIRCSEPALQRLMGACLNTLYNSAQETAVDGMGRERQQYSGDGSHQLHGVYLALGDTKLPARFLQTFSQGQVPDGYFLDCWPAYDRLARLMERPINMTPWGPLLDHGVGFAFDTYHHYLYTGDLAAVDEPLRRLQKFLAYLHRLQGADGLLPVDGLGIPNVWIDHYAYKRQRHKQCAFNLYCAAMLRHAFVPLARAAGESRWASDAGAFAGAILKGVRREFWSERRHLFVNNLPWEEEEREERMCDRSLATALLFGLSPGTDTTAIVSALADCPPSMGLSYPANAGWRYWALAEGGRTDVILREFRERWAAMQSVILNNSLAEIWNAHPDSGDLWSHCAIVPLYVTFMSLAGIRPVSPGFARCHIRPQPADLEELALTARTVRGDIRFSCRGKIGDRLLELEVPAGMEATLLLDPRETPGLPSAATGAGHARKGYVLPSGTRVQLPLRFT
jgi:alpha-L-rhamnosidase